MTITLAVSGDFNLGKILKYKPFFFFYGDGSNRGVMLPSGPAELSFSQKGNKLVVKASRDLFSDDEEAVKAMVNRCFGCSEEFGPFYKIVKKDPFLSKFSDRIQGNRILSAPTDFEAMTSIICSQNVSFAQYKVMIGKIFDAYGPPSLFPAPKDILKDTSILASCGVGYRSEYIVNMARFFDGKPDLISEEDTKKLAAIKGVGPYSLNIFRLFQRRDWSSFYVDSLIAKIVTEDYGENVTTPSGLRAFAEKQWGAYPGLAEVFLQKFLNDNP